MNSKAINFFKNFSYAFTSNLTSLLLSSLVVLIVPRLIGVEEYGYWQLYLFYSSYVGFLHFGWSDGIYLNYGGKQYSEIDKKSLFSQFYMLLGMQLLIAIMILGLSNRYITDSDKSFAISMTAICMIVSNIRSMPLFIFQATNRIKEYAYITIVGKILNFIIIIIFFLYQFANFKILVYADLLGKAFSLSLSIYYLRDIVFFGTRNFSFVVREALDNINSGIKLMFSNIASMLIIGVQRFFIERAWDVSTFGKISLILSISKLVMLFINAIGIIIFPILRRTNKDNLSKLYKTLRNLLMVVLFGSLLFYYPAKVILKFWLPAYSDSLIYMGILLPIIIFEGKMGLLINTYLKTLRKEKIILRVNITSFVVSLVFTIITIYYFKSLELAVLSIVIVLWFRALIAEIYLSSILDLDLNQDFILELMMTAIFILLTWFIDSWLFIPVYLTIYSLLIYIKRRDISESYKNIIKLVMK